MEEHPRQSLWDTAQHNPDHIQLPLRTSFRCPAHQSHPTTSSFQYAMRSLVSMSPCVIFCLKWPLLVHLPNSYNTQAFQSSVKADILYSQDLGLCLLTHYWHSRNLSSPQMSPSIPTTSTSDNHIALFLYAKLAHLTVSPGRHF